MFLFIELLASASVISVASGIYLLNRRELEIGALIGIYPIVWGLCLGALAALLWSIMHLSIRIV